MIYKQSKRRKAEIVSLALRLRDMTLLVIDNVLMVDGTSPQLNDKLIIMYNALKYVVPTYYN